MNGFILYTHHWRRTVVGDGERLRLRLTLLLPPRDDGVLHRHNLIVSEVRCGSAAID